MSYGSIYFWTATIRNWHRLLEPDDFKQVIVGSLDNLSQRRLVDVFAFVVMPNHVHLIWRPLQPNGKETTQGSFLKFTAHEFKKKLMAVQAIESQFEFRQRDSMPAPVYSKAAVHQKPDDLHRDPTIER